MVTLHPSLFSTDFGTCSYQCFLPNCTPVSLHMLKCSWAHTLSCLFVFCSFASIGHADIMWSIVLSNYCQSIIIIIIAIECSFGGSSSYTSIDKTNKNKYTQKTIKNTVQTIQYTVQTIKTVQNNTKHSTNNTQHSTNNTKTAQTT